MPLYSKNGSIPYSHKDETDGWIEVEEAPTPGEGQEVAWWYPPGWVVRPIKPVKEGFDYSWSQSDQRWVEFDASTQQTSEVQPFEPVVSFTVVETASIASTSFTAIGVSLSGAETITGV